MGNVINLMRDSLTNLVSRMGTGRDKASHSFYSHMVLDDAEIANSYRSAWLPRKIVDIPALDSCRKWRNWQAENDVIELIEREENRLNLRGKVLEARIKARLFGGAAILIGTGDADLTQSIELERIGKDGLKYLTVFTRRQLTAGDLDYDPASEWFGKPSIYKLQGKEGQGLDVHPSRLVIFHGNQTADDDLSASVHRGWGDSVLIAVMDAIKNADSTAANIASLVFEAKIDIIKVPNFMASLADEGYKQKLIERYTLANTAKGINGTLMLDKEEEYESKSASFAQLPEILTSFLQITAGAADIPVTRLLGQSPAGLNSTGEADLRNYYDRISASQEIEMTPAMHRMDEALIRSATGVRDPSIHYVWSPLWQVSDKEKADIFKTKADAARTIAGTGGMSPAIIPIEALSDALVNALVEDGSLPGLEAAIEEFGSLSEQDDDDEDTAAALPAPANTNEQMRLAANDAVARWKSGLPPRSQGDVEAIYAYYRGDTRDAAPRTLYVRRDVLNAAEIIAWAKEQGFATTLPADDMHVTITFSRDPVDWMEMGSTWEDEVKVPRGGARLMEKFGEARVLLFNSNMLRWRHDEMVEKGASWDHPEYQPHITISYDPDSPDLANVEPYQGEIMLGPEIFQEVFADWLSRVSED